MTQTINSQVIRNLHIQLKQNGQFSWSKSTAFFPIFSHCSIQKNKKNSIPLDGFPTFASSTHISRETNRSKSLKCQLIGKGQQTMRLNDDDGNAVFSSLNSALPSLIFFSINLIAVFSLRDIRYNGLSLTLSLNLTDETFTYAAYCSWPHEERTVGLGRGKRRTSCYAMRRKLRGLYSYTERVICMTPWQVSNCLYSLSLIPIILTNKRRDWDARQKGDSLEPFKK